MSSIISTSHVYQFSICSYTQNLTYLIIIDKQKSACLLRKAAGIYKHLNDEVLPLLQSILPPEKPPETATNVSFAMNNICLAEAQVSFIASLYRCY